MSAINEEDLFALVLHLNAWRKQLIDGLESMMGEERGWFINIRRRFLLWFEEGEATPQFYQMH